MTTKIKAVRIMCDFCADGVWSAPSVLNSTMDGFRVSEELWGRLQGWQRWHDSQDGTKYPDPDFDLAGFVAEGYSIARAVKAELPGWVVIYGDEALLLRSINSGDKSINWLIEMP